MFNKCTHTHITLVLLKFKWRNVL